MSERVPRLVDLIQEAPDLCEVLPEAGPASVVHVCPINALNACATSQQTWPGPDDVFLRIHGDEGPYFKKRNLLVLSLSFPHNHGEPCLQLLVSQMCCQTWFSISGQKLQDTIMTRLALCPLVINLCDSLQLFHSCHA